MNGAIPDIPFPAECEIDDMETDIVHLPNEVRTLGDTTADACVGADDITKLRSVPLPIAYWYPRFRCVNVV